MHVVEQLNLNPDHMEQLRKCT